VPDTGLAERVERIEAHLAIQHLAIQHLAIRYAMAVDARDMNAWAGCFRPDVDMGPAGRRSRTPTTSPPGPARSG